MKKTIACFLVSSIFLIGCSNLSTRISIGVQALAAREPHDEARIGTRIDIDILTDTDALDPDELVSWPPNREIVYPLDKRALVGLLAYLILVNAMPNSVNLGFYPFIY